MDDWGWQWRAGKKPDLVLCDVMMPELDGYGVLQAMQSDARAGIDTVYFF